MKIASFASLFAAQKPPRPLRPEDARSRIATSLLERETKRFDEMREAAERLKTLPRSNPIREQAKARAAALLQRIRALKMAIATATPEQAKALASQLRQLAAQLAGVPRSRAASPAAPRKAAGWATWVR